MPVAVVAAVLVVKLDWPRTIEAASPVENPALEKNPITRLLFSSATHRLPDESNATPEGWLKPVAVVAATAVLKLDWPRTSYAAWSVENGVVNSVTRSL